MGYKTRKQFKTKTLQFLRNIMSLIHCLKKNYHKYSSRCSSGITVRHRAAHRLVIIRLLGDVEGVVVEDMHQSWVHLTEEHADLQEEEEL